MKSIHTDKAPAAIGPYSQAVIHRGWIFVSGQIGFDSATGRMVEGGADAQTEQVMRNLAAILEASGSSLAQVVRTTVYLADMASFEEMNSVYARFLGAHRPARATVQAAALPRGAAVEMDAIAFVGEDDAA